MDLRADANAMRGYGPVGMQNVGFSSMGQNINPEFAMKYGQTGPSLAQAAGMVRQQRAAEERMDEAMKRERKAEERQQRIDYGMQAGQTDPAIARAVAKEFGYDVEEPQGIDKLIEDGDLSARPEVMAVGTYEALPQEEKNYYLKYFGQVLGNGDLSDEEKLEEFKEFFPTAQSFWDGLLNNTDLDKVFSDPEIYSQVKRLYGGQSRSPQQGSSRAGSNPASRNSSGRSRS